MWGLFVGMLIGGLQILAVNKLGRMMFDGKAYEKVIGFVLFMLKIGVIVAILYFISTVSLVHLVWTAGGILLGLLAASLYMLKRRRRFPVNGDDSGND
jgi:hypothetical protein